MSSLVLVRRCRRLRYFKLGFCCHRANNRVSISAFGLRDQPINGVAALRTLCPTWRRTRPRTSTPLPFPGQACEEAGDCLERPAHCLGDLRSAGTFVASQHRKHLRMFCPRPQFRAIARLRCRSASRQGRPWASTVPVSFSDIIVARFAARELMYKKRGPRPSTNRSAWHLLATSAPARAVGHSVS